MLQRICKEKNKNEMLKQVQHDHIKKKEPIDEIGSFFLKSIQKIILSQNELY